MTIAMPLQQAPFDSSILAVVAIVFTLLGALISSVVSYYALKKQDERRFKREDQKKHEFNQQRKISAYRRLQGLTERVTRGTAGEHPPSFVNGDELEKIESTLAQYFG